MKNVLLPVILLLLGLGGGVGAGIMLMPAPAEETAEEEAEDDPSQPSSEHASEDHAKEEEAYATAVEYLNMSNQFIIPLVNTGVVNGIVVVTISLEVKEGSIADVNKYEPKIRDKFLQVLFNHANNGGFDGNFTEFRYLRSLKEELLRNAVLVAGRDVTDVLILDLVRQDP